MKRLLVLILVVMGVQAFAQKVTLDPVITPALFTQSTTITVKYDVTGTSLAALTDAYAWVWIPGNTAIDAKFNKNPADGTISAAKFVKSSDAGKTYFTLTFKPSDFFTQSISSQTKMGILLKGTDWSNGQTSDYLVDFWDGSFQVAVTSPTARPLFVNTNDVISIKAETPVVADYDLYVDNQLITEQNATTTFSYDHTVTETSGNAVVKIVATTATASSEETFQYLISGNSPTVARPAGIIPGINYKDGDNSKVTLCLLAPGKTSVYALGDFSDWEVSSDYLMNRDGEFFWIQLTGLTAGQEYAFQYLVDESIYVADPYADKILDPDDQYIPDATYPNLKDFPAKALKNDWFNNRLSVFQTAQTPFNWVVPNFEKPAKEKLVVYELLVRDFFANGERNYQNLIDTISYFKRLGINAIELMPVMEFNGNESWGYNPTFMFAPDKYYGTREKFKEFIDVCHQNGIAVILDIALNHQDLPNPYVMMDFNFGTYKPNPTNKWFNVDATHPFSVFYDMNHESSYTKDYVDTIAYHWLHDYKVDGFRFDLAKGFTQQNHPTDVNAWSAYDASRIAIWKRIADQIWSHTPEAYIILEHFAASSEEKELVEYRAGEAGKGMMVWGNLNYAYNQATMGFESGSNINGIYHATRNMTVPGVVGYMESHDEERLMYKNTNFGTSLGNYNVKDLATGLSRIKAANLLFYTVPGPKMLWQFGELGFDFSINTCEDLTVNNNCRISPKPVKWDYLENGLRNSLYRQAAELIKLRNTYDVFYAGTATFDASSLVKQITLKNNPYVAAPTSTDDMNVQIAVNLDLSTKIVSVAFPHTGTWYDFYDNGAPITVSATPMTVSLKPGEHKLYTDVAISPSVVTATEEEIVLAEVDVYPNPAKNTIKVKSDVTPVLDVYINNIQGARMHPSRLSKDTWDIQNLSRGLYIIEVQTSKGYVRKKIFKE